MQLGERKRPLYAAALVFAFLLTIHTQATVTTNPPKYTADNKKAEILNGAEIKETLGSKVDLSLKFKDENGNDVVLGQYFKGAKPVVLVMTYFNCPHLCTLVLNGALDAMKGLQWTAGKEFEAVVVSIDHRETPQLAKKKKQSYLSHYGRLEGDSGWHFLTTPDAQTIKALGAQTGFGYRWDEKNKDYAHSAGLFFYTPMGVLSRVLFGVQYFSRDFKLALGEAAGGKIGTILDRIQLFCYAYDPHAKRYSVAAMNIMRMGGAATLVAFGGYMFFFWRMQRKGRKGPGEGRNT